MIKSIIRSGSRHRQEYPKIVSGHYTCDASYQNLRPHGSVDWLFIASVDGCGRVQMGDKELCLPRGHIICFLPNIPQSYGTHPDNGHWELSWCHVEIRPTWPDWLQWPEVDVGLLHLSVADEQLFEEILDALRCSEIEAAKRTHVGDELACNAIERALLMAHYANPKSDETSQIDSRVHRALNFIASNGDRAVSLADIAAHCELSPSRLSYLFSDQVGMSPIRFHEEQRLQRAADLLRETTLSVKAVANEVGFDDAFHFSTRFRAIFGASPRTFRSSQ